MLLQLPLLEKSRVLQFGHTVLLLMQVVLQLLSIPMNPQLFKEVWLLLDVELLVLQKLILKDKKSPLRSKLQQLLLTLNMFTGLMLDPLKLVSK
jgi:hypothetical protein